MARTTLDIDAAERLAGELTALARLARRLGPVLEAAEPVLDVAFHDAAEAQGRDVTVSGPGGVPAEAQSPASGQLSGNGKADGAPTGEERRCQECKKPYTRSQRRGPQQILPSDVPQPGGG